MSELVFLLEEESAKAMLEGLLPRLLPEKVWFRCLVFEGKSDLEGQLVRRLRGYNTPGARFVILRDQDAADCLDVKAGLADLCRQAGRERECLVRIACKELESWYLADLAAVETGLQVDGLERLQNRRVFRTPDTVVSPSKELSRIAPTYQKVGGSRAIGPHLDLNNARSTSFSVFVAGVRDLARIIKEQQDGGSGQS